MKLQVEKGGDYFFSCTIANPQEAVVFIYRLAIGGFVRDLLKLMPTDKNCIYGAFQLSAGDCVEAVCMSAASTIEHMELLPMFPD